MLKDVIIMFVFPLYNLILTATVFFKIFSLVDGHGMCASNEHVDLESNRYYKPFMSLDTIGVLQCIKVCESYKLCEKIHHNREQLKCDLMMTYAKKSNMTSLLDVQFVQNYISDCSLANCSETEVCVKMKEGSHLCLEEDICPTADWVPFNHKCYFFQENDTLADENLQICAAMNGSLVRLDNNEVISFLQEEMARNEIQFMWIAANDRVVEGEWMWAPGDGIFNAFWGPDEPNNYDNEDCVVLCQATAYWQDRGCSSYYAAAVCEVNISIVHLCHYIFINKNETVDRGFRKDGN